MLWILVALSGVMFSGVVTSAEDSERLKTRFLEEAPQQWQEYETFVARLQGKVLSKQTLDGKIVHHHRLEFKQNADCKLCLSQSLLKGKSDGELRAYNRRYGFTLRRGSPDRPWALVARENRDGDASTQSMKRVRSDFDFLFSPLLRIYNVSLPQLTRGASFRIIDIKGVNHQGEELVQLDFDNAHPLGEGETPIQRGILLLDRSNSWCLRSCTFQAQWNELMERTTRENRIASSEAMHPVPKKVLETTELSYYGKKSGPKSSTYEIDYDLKESVQLPGDDEFTLSTFGFPEPTEVGKRPMPWYLWVGLAGIICLSLAALFRRLARRGEISVQKPTPPQAS